MLPSSFSSTATTSGGAAGARREEPRTITAVVGSGKRTGVVVADGVPASSWSQQEAELGSGNKGSNRRGGGGSGTGGGFVSSLPHPGWPQYHFQTRGSPLRYTSMSSNSSTTTALYYREAAEEEERPQQSPTTIPQQRHQYPRPQNQETRPMSNGTSSRSSSSIYATPPASSASAQRPDSSSSSSTYTTPPTSSFEPPSLSTEESSQHLLLSQDELDKQEYERRSWQLRPQDSGVVVDEDEDGDDGFQTATAGGVGDGSSSGGGRPSSNSNGSSGQYFYSPGGKGSRHGRSPTSSTAAPQIWTTEITKTSALRIKQPAVTLASPRTPARRDKGPITAGGSAAVATCGSSSSGGGSTSYPEMPPRTPETRRAAAEAVAAAMSQQRRRVSPLPPPSQRSTPQHFDLFGVLDEDVDEDFGLSRLRLTDGDDGAPFGKGKGHAGVATRRTKPVAEVAPPRSMKSVAGGTGSDFDHGYEHDIDSDDFGDIHNGGFNQEVLDVLLDGFDRGASTRSVTMRMDSAGRWRMKRDSAGSSVQG